MQKGTIITRDEILKKVWENHGFSGSNNSLNVAASELRKAFTQLEINPSLIRTFRQKGLSYVGEVEPIIVKNHTNETLPPLAHEYRVKKIKAMISCIIFLIIIPVLSISISNFKITKASAQKKTYILSVNNCEIYDIGTESANEDEIKSVISKNNIECDKRQDVFISLSRKENQLSRSIFIGTCYLDEEGRSKYCVSTLNGEWGNR